jgi:hypothetical protein
MKRVLARYGWVLAASIVGVTCLSIVVASATGRDVTAQAVVVVSPGTASTGPGQASEARALASTYARQVAADGLLLRDISARTGVPRGAVATGLHAAQPSGTALVNVRFTASTPSTAVRGIKALTAFVANPPAASSLSVAAPRLVATSERATASGNGFVAGASFVIPPNSATPGPGNADQATKDAAIFAGLIPEDQETLAAVGRQIAVPAGEVMAAVSASNSQNSATIDLSYKATSPSLAQRGAIALAHAVSGAHPASANIPAGSLSIVSVPPVPDAANPLKLALPAGIVLGAILGIVLMAAFDRAFPRINDEEALSEVAGCPAVLLSLGQRERLDALRARWALMVPGGRGTLAVVSVATAQAALSERLADAINGDVLADAGGSDAAREPFVTTAGRRTDRAEPSRFLVETGARSRLDGTSEETLGVPTDWGVQAYASETRGEEILARAALTPGFDGSTERIVLQSDLAILAVGQGARVSDVERTVKFLEDFGRPPAWAVLMPANGKP